MAAFVPTELLDRAARVFRAEAQDGYRDRIVYGGLGAFVRNLHAAADTPTVGRAVALLHDYGSLDTDQRAVRLRQALNVLREEPIKAPPPPVVPLRPSALATPVGVTLATPITELKGIGPVRGRLYARLNLHTVRDLLFHFPTRHQTGLPVAPINSLFFQAEGAVVGNLERLEVESLPRGLKRLKGTIRDGTGVVYAVWLRHGVARLGVQPNEAILVSGPLKQQGRQLIFDNPDYERADGPRIHTQGLVPVHPLTAGLSDRELRNRIHWAIGHFAALVEEPLPEAIRTEYELLPIGPALRQMHFPSTQEEYTAARRRFAFDELLTIQLLVLQRRLTWQHDPAAVLATRLEVIAAMRSGMPFELTAAQQRVTDEILRDMARGKPMTRLVQGEVGSGKTAVAALALINAVANGAQGALMTPTEILAEQHYATLSRLLEVAGPRLVDVLGRAPEIRLLTGSINSRERARVYAETGAGVADILVGTQALIQDKLEFANLGLVVVDEQHRFGVRQRVTLRRRATEQDSRLVPHLLVMTATPIPRTLALSIYGDLDLSALDEMPAGRTFPKTVVLGPDERHLAYERVRRAAAAGEQAFIICPLVEESEVLEAKSATEEYERLRGGELAALKLGLLHGRLRPHAKDAVMRAFRDHEFDVLVSTAVVEVGVDVPNATVMLIEGAERFGLAQLHQFRGRVGRGGQASVCVLLTDLPDPQANERLRVVKDNTNGLALAEYDLRLRGPGDYFGVRQSGLPELRVARLDDAPLVEAARAAATSILTADPELSAKQHGALAAHLRAFVADAGDPG